MSENLISVIVPVYNIEDYISKTINSILNQTYANLEVIIVDDGSTDKSGEIIDALAEKDSRVKVIHKSNGGVTSARIEGINTANGDWIGFVDGDDYIEPDMYERLLSNALKYNAQISHCGYQMVFPSRVDYYYNTDRLVQQDKLTGLKDLLDGSYIEPGLWNKLFHKTLFHSLLHGDTMDWSIKNTEDLLMNYFLFKQAKKSIYEDFCPYHYMLRDNSAATSKPNKNKLNDPIKVLNIILSDTQGDKELNDIVLRRLASTYVSGSSRKKTKAPDFEKEHIEYCRKQIKILDKKRLSKRLKSKALLCSLVPGLYGAVHRIYSKITGIDKKYEVR